MSFSILTYNTALVGAVMWALSAGAMRVAPTNIPAAADNAAMRDVFTWQNLAPKGAARPEGPLSEAIVEYFRSFDVFKRQLTQAASTIMGSGWAALIWEPVGRRLLTTQIYDHQSNLAQAGIPLMVLDAWEHAYYLQYENRKAEFFEAAWNVWNWRDISDRFAAARLVSIALVDARR